MATTCGTSLDPNSNRLSHSKPRTLDFHATGLIEQAFAAACQAPHAAGAHRPQALQFLAFRLFQYTAIPDTQRCFASLLHQLSALLGFLPQHFFDHLGLPALMV